MNTRAALLAALLSLAVSGCAPTRPDFSLVLWEQPSPQVAAQAHAQEMGFIALRTDGRSMEPLIVEGDWVVVDPSYPWDKLRSGYVILYAPDWHPGLVLHACAAPSGKAWIMDGINNEHYENKANGGLHVYRQHYRGRCVQIYTTRKKV